LKDRNRTEAIFAKANGQPVSAQAARADRRGMLQKAGIEKKISPHKLHHTYATNLLNAGAERVDIKALLGHESIATTQIYTNTDCCNSLNMMDHTAWSALFSGIPNSAAGNSSRQSDRILRPFRSVRLPESSGSQGAEEVRRHRPFPS